MMHKRIAVLVSMMLITGLAFAADATADLKKADEGWSNAASAKNIDQFMNFVRDDAYACGLDGKWVHGKEAVRQEWAGLFSDPSLKINWTADTAEVSKDGKLGYTRGTFHGSMGGKPIGGSYATVWKKDKDGQWRVVVDIASPAQQ